jgi:2-methylcitrate dehydratase PrpD
VVISELGWDQGMFSAIGEDADCTHRFPNEYNYHMEVTTTLGQRFSAATAYPQGHWCKPFSDAEVEHKFCSLAGDVLSEQQGHKTLECLWSLEQLPNLQTLVDGLVVTQG